MHFIVFLTFLLYLGFAKALVNVEDYLLYDPIDIKNHGFDYIIVGGGVTGLAAAARLTENPEISVLVIESGFWETDREIGVHDLTDYGRQFGTAMDHGYTTTVQAADNRAHVLSSGHGLGGSSLINGGAWTRPAKVQVDSWGTVFGNDGWSWDDLSSYMKRTETVRAPTARQQAAGYSLNSSCHGDEGPISIGPLDDNKPYSPLMMALMDTAKEMGIPVGNDLSCGNPRGVSMLPTTTTAEGKRSDAGRAWLLPAIERPNLKVLVGQWVGKVIFDTSREIPKVIGVQYGRYRGPVYEARVNFEVLLAAGALISPLILEYSGIGLSHVLREAGVAQIVELPVGVNQQDQTNVRVSNAVHEIGAGQGQATYFASFDEIFSDFKVTAHAMLHNRTLLRQWAGQVVSHGGFHDVELLMVQYDNYVNHIQNHDIATSELMLDAWGELGFTVMNLLPFSRGYVHIRSHDPYLRDAINNPRYLSNEFDILSQAAASKLARELSSKGPMAEYWKREINPGFEFLPKEASIHAWSTWVKHNYHPNLHSLGTCSMMKRSLGGVVDNKAQVYGTQGLRVIDASILPTQISSHMMAVLYGVVEKIVASILEDHDKHINASKAASKKSREQQNLLERLKQRLNIGEMKNLDASFWGTA